MKLSKLFFSLTAVFFGTLLVMVSALRLSWQAKSPTKVALAQEGAPSAPLEEVDTDEQKMAESQAEDQEVDYYLPYPGILPDHPLYWLKMVRDRVMLWGTKDPFQQFQRRLLYADKRIGAAEALIKGGQTELGVTTATKAEKYLEQAVGQYKNLKAEGKINPETEDRLEKATLKHRELVTELLKQVPDSAKSVLEKTLETTQFSYETIVNESK